jgi:hypothetical protein
VTVAWLFCRDGSQRYSVGASKLTSDEARRIGKAVSRIPEFMMQRWGVLSARRRSSRDDGRLIGRDRIEVVHRDPSSSCVARIEHGRSLGIMKLYAAQPASLDVIPKQNGVLTRQPVLSNTLRPFDYVPSRPIAPNPPKPPPP